MRQDVSSVLEELFEDKDRWLMIVLEKKFLLSLPSRRL